MNRMALVLLFSIPTFLQAQFFSGYYQSEPRMEGFDHFIIRHQHGDEGKYEGIFTLHAFVDGMEMFAYPAETVKGEEAQYFIDRYGSQKDILSVHKMKIMWDGVEWEFFMLGYLDKQGHGRFVVVEEIFDDEEESTLLSINQYLWTRSHHLSRKYLVKKD